MYCKRCDYQGLIYQARIKKIGKTVYTCDECDALWTDPTKILTYPGAGYGIDFYDFDKFLCENKLNPNNVKLVDEDGNLYYPDMSFKNYDIPYLVEIVWELDWDKSILNNPAIVFCPRCQTRGIIYKATVGALGVSVYFCDNCNAVWHLKQETGVVPNQTLLGFLKTKGLDYTNAHLDDFDYEWNKKC